MPSEDVDYQEMDVQKLRREVEELQRAVRSIEVRIGIGGTSRCRPSHTTGHTGPYHGGSAGRAFTGCPIAEVGAS